jgi:thioredoxin reductase
MNQSSEQQRYDVVVVGGSAAGLSAGLTLGRSRRRTLIIDSGKPCNRQTPHSHNFLTRDGETPMRIAQVAREQLLNYPTVELLAATAEQVVRSADGFTITTSTGQTIPARKLLLATGITDQLPPLPGFAECWGISVLHCPYCHGYEVHSQPLGVLSNGDAGFEFAKLIQHWSPDLRLFTNGPSTLTAEQQELLTAHGVAVEETPLAALEHEAGQLHHVQLTDGRRVPLTALFARVPFAQHSDLAAQLGCAFTDAGLIQIDEMRQTTVPGVYAAGDNSYARRQLIGAAAHGVEAAAGINHELIKEDWAVLEKAPLSLS